MTELQRTAHWAGGDSPREWVVLGDAGAVSFLAYPEEKATANEIAACISIHSRQKFSTLPKKGKCDVLPEGRCYEQVKLQGAHELRVLSGHGKDYAIIWEVLEGWYHATFGKRG